MREIAVERAAAAANSGARGTADEDSHSASWTQTSETERSLVRGQLERMLESPLFCHSKRYPKLLRYLVEQALEGNEALLKERTLGVSVFDRAPDYDTNQDTVVRLTASEVRKRIAQYYHQPEHAGELQIDLRAGSYVPVFRRPDASAVNGRAVEASGETRVRDSGAGSTASGVTERASYPAPQAGASVLEAGQAGARLRHGIWWIAGAAGLLVAAAGAMVGWRADVAAHSANRQLWAPILSEPGQVQLVIADLSASVSAAAQHDREEAAGLTNLLRMGEMVNYRDTLAQSGLVAFLAEHNKPYVLELSTQASYPDLQRGASVLVGGLDNVWTMRVTDLLRFHFVRRGTSYVFGIVDRQHPDQGGWNVNMVQSFDHATEDYAIVARIFDETTGRPVLVVAGLGANGTNAAARFLLDSARTAELTHYAPRDWERLNMEAVLETQILDNHAGPPHVVSCTFW